MSKGNNIKWRDKDLKELQRVVKNFNAKIARVAKKNPTSAPFLPEKLSMKNLKRKIETRADFNREVKSAQRFQRKGSEEVITTPRGFSLSKYDIKEAQIKTRIVNNKRSSERKKLDLKVETGTMGQISKQNLKPKTFSLNKSAKEWDKFIESLEREVSTNFRGKLADQYKQNYLDVINDFLGEDGKELHDYIKNMSPEKVYENSITNPILSIQFISDPLPTEDIARYALHDWKELE